MVKGQGLIGDAMKSFWYGLLVLATSCDWEQSDIQLIPNQMLVQRECHVGTFVG